MSRTRTSSIMRRTGSWRCCAVSIASMAASLGGLDCLAFTGGVGENAPTVRQHAADGLGFLGIVIEEDRNRRNRGDGEIGSTSATVATLVISAREDLEIALEVRQVLEQ